MLRITVELIPHGLEHQKKILGIAEICNDGTGTENNGNYTYELKDYRGEGRTWHGKIFNHFRQLSAWVLISKVLEEIYDA